MTNVLRDGKWKTVEANLLVPGDVIEISYGILIPADIILFEIEGDLEVINLNLTGDPENLKRSVT